MNQEFEGEILLSICVSSYNRLPQVKSLVEEILKCRSERFNIVITDDASSPDVFSFLEDIHDKRLLIHRNVYNLGALQNWYQTINNGTGKYILHLLDRDMIQHEYLEIILSILSANEIGYGYIGGMFASNLLAVDHKEHFRVYQGNEAALVFGLTQVHPSGFLVRKSSWKRIRGKEVFFDNNQGSIYPHSFIYSILALQEPGVHIDLNFIEIIDSKDESAFQIQSNFYSESDKELYWMPEAQLREILVFTEFCLKESMWNGELDKQILQIRFKENLLRATDGYRKAQLSWRHCMHYGVEPSLVELNELGDIAKQFTNKYLEKAKKWMEKEMYEPFAKQIVCISSESALIVKKRSQDWILRKSLEEFLYSAWLNRELGKNHLDNYFCRYDIKKIAIYGYGDMGKKLRRELEGSSVSVACFIDAKAGRFCREDVEVFHLNEEMPKVDAIVVSLHHLFNEIYSELKEKIGCPIISIAEVILKENC